MAIIGRTLADAERERGPEDRNTIQLKYRMASLLKSQGQLYKAQVHNEGVVETSRRVLGPEHPDKLHYTNGLATLYFYQHKLDKSRTRFEQALHVTRRVLSPGHSKTRMIATNLAAVYYRQGRLDQSRTLLEQFRETFTSFESTLKLAEVLAAQGRLADARALCETNLEQGRTRFGEEDQKTLTIAYVLARLYQLEGQHEAAERLSEKSREISRLTSDPVYPNTI